MTLRKSGGLSWRLSERAKRDRWCRRPASPTTRHRQVAVAAPRPTPRPLRSRDLPLRCLPSSDGHLPVTNTLPNNWNYRSNHNERWEEGPRSYRRWTQDVPRILERPQAPIFSYLSHVRRNLVPITRQPPLFHPQPRRPCPSLPRGCYPHPIR